jgi:hypothetical protein
LIDLNFIDRFKTEGKLKKSKKRKLSYLEGFVGLFRHFTLGWVCVLQPGLVNSDIKMTLHLNDADLGTILFLLPVGQLMMMPFGKLVTRFGSHRIGVFSLIMLLS